MERKFYGLGPTMMNGCWYVRASCLTEGGGGTRGGRWILATNQRTGEHVVSWHGHEDGVWDLGWGQGHYFDSLSEATRYFTQEVARWECQVEGVTE